MSKANNDELDNILAVHLDNRPEEYSLLKQAIERLLATERAKLLQEVLACAPKEKQVQYISYKKPGIVEEDMQRFYRYGGYDFAIKEYTAALKKLFEK